MRSTNYTTQPQFIPTGMNDWATLSKPSEIRKTMALLHGDVGSQFIGYCLAVENIALCNSGDNITAIQYLGD